jgi:carbohydrate kinase (thermoresistant glucokinase family)
MESGKPILVMGVSGSGKTTLGQALAAALGWPLIEADDFHSPANVAKMKNGIPLTDADRAPWLEAVQEAMAQYTGRGQSVVVSCSALKKSYRDLLRRSAPSLLTVCLSADKSTLRDRLAHRPGHFMPADLLDSQFATLEPPVAGEQALTLDADAPVAANVAAVLAALARLSR